MNNVGMNNWSAVALLLFLLDKRRHSEQREEPQTNYDEFFCFVKTRNGAVSPIINYSLYIYHFQIKPC